MIKVWTLGGFTKMWRRDNDLWNVDHTRVHDEGYRCGTKSKEQNQEDMSIAQDSGMYSEAQCVEVAYSLKEKKSYCSHIAEENRRIILNWG